MLDVRSDRLANVFVILVYAPFLLLLPVLLLGGVVFVVVPGGFIIVLGALSYAATGFAGLLGLAASRRSRARASHARRANTTFEKTSPSRRAPLGPRGAIAPNPIAVSLANARVVGPAPSLVPHRRGPDKVDLAGPLEGGSAPEMSDGARPFERASVAEALPQPPGRALPSGPARKDSFLPPSASGSEARA
jgi:hypothetical protein